MVRTIFLIASVITLTFGQNDDRQGAIDRLFNTSRANTWEERYEEITKPPPDSLGALEKCGEGRDAGVRMCVPYYNCDGITNTIIDDGSRSGAGVIDISRTQNRQGNPQRVGANSCDHYLEVCCKIPEGGVSSSTPVIREPDTGGDTVPPTQPTQPTRPTPRPTQPTPKPTTPPTPVPSQCGIRNNNGIDFKISGNFDNEAEYGEFPWMVAILKTNFNPSTDNSLAICGGSLIAPNVVLTGAHCVYKHKTSEIKIRAGEWDTQTENERLPYQERRVAQVISHKNFNPQTLFNDFALLILESPFEEAEHIRTICLPNQNEVIDSKNCYATGWGKDVFGREGKYSVILKKIELPIVAHGQCEKALRKTRLGQNFKLDWSLMCAGGEEGKDACTGDGGSPLVCPDPKNPTRYVQAGIVAWGIGCGESNIPGVYADVAKFREWIDVELRKVNIGSSSYTN